MKTTFQLLLLSLFCLSCNEGEVRIKNSAQVTAIFDITDRINPLPDAQAIIKLYGLSKNKNTEARFRLLCFTDKQLNPDLELHLEDGITTERRNTMDDPYYRDKLIISYHRKIREAVSKFNERRKSDSSLNNSEIFATIANELQKMKNRRADKNILLAYSDLQENSGFVNCYDKDNQQILFKNPGKIVDIFNNSKLLPDDLSGIEVIFIYQPTSRTEDQRFIAMAGIFKKLLEPRGATVRIQASNNYIN